MLSLIRNAIPIARLLDGRLYLCHEYPPSTPFPSSQLHQPLSPRGIGIQLSMWSPGREVHGPSHNAPTELPPQRNMKLRTACDRCHQSKMKCSSTVPCVSCKTSREQCIYSASNRSGRPKGVKNKRTSEQMSDNQRAVKAKSPSIRNMSPVQPNNNRCPRRQQQPSMAPGSPCSMAKGLTNYDGRLLDSAQDKDFTNDVISPFKSDFPWDLWDFNVEENLREREITTQNVNIDLCIGPTPRYHNLANVDSSKKNRVSQITTRLIYAIPSEQVVPKHSSSYSMIAQITILHQVLPAWETAPTSVAGPLPQRFVYAQQWPLMTKHSPPRKRSSRHRLCRHPRPKLIRIFDSKHQGSDKVSNKTASAIAWNSIPPFFTASRSSNEAKTPRQQSTQP